MSTTSPQGYVVQTLPDRYIKVRILEAFLLANAKSFGEESTYDATSTEDIIKVTVKRHFTKVVLTRDGIEQWEQQADIVDKRQAEILSLQRESYPKRFQDDSSSD